MRLVSLACSNTEIVAALGLSHLLVGVDDDSDHPSEVVGRLPRVGRDLDVDADKVAALKPDLVLASLTVPGHEKVVARLAEKNLNMMVLAPKSVADTLRSIQWVGGALGVPSQASALCKGIRTALEPAPDWQTGPRILVEWWPKPCIAAGRQSWVEQMLHAAGAQNAAHAIDSESRPLTDAEVVGMAPDAVVISWCGVKVENYRPEVVRRRPGWQTVPAVEHDHIVPISEAFMGRPGPRIVEGVRQLRAVVERVKAGSP
jgi:iron complex transport system substrate-binding protein